MWSQNEFHQSNSLSHTVSRRCVDSETYQVFPNRTRLGPKGRIRRQADFGTTSLVVPKGMPSGTPTTLQRIVASMLVQKTRLSRSPCCKPICTPLKCDRSICIFAAARFWQEFTRTTIVLCTSILSAIQSVTVRLVKE